MRTPKVFSSVTKSCISAGSSSSVGNAARVGIVSEAAISSSGGAALRLMDASSDGTSAPCQKGQDLSQSRAGTMSGPTRCAGTPDRTVPDTKLFKSFKQCSGNIHFFESFPRRYSYLQMFTCIFPLARLIESMTEVIAELGLGGRAGHGFLQDVDGFAGLAGADENPAQGIGNRWAGVQAIRPLRRRQRPLVALLLVSPRQIVQHHRIFRRFLQYGF